MSTFFLLSLSLSLPTLSWFVCSILFSTVDFGWTWNRRWSFSTYCLSFHSRKNNCEKVSVRVFPSLGLDCFLGRRRYDRRRHRPALEVEAYVLFCSIPPQSAETSWEWRSSWVESTPWSACPEIAVWRPCWESRVSDGTRCPGRESPSIHSEIELYPVQCISSLRILHRDAASPVDVCKAPGRAKWLSRRE